MRKVIQLTIKNGRDTGKVFQLTEMAPSKGFKWAFRAMLAIGNSGLILPDNLKDMSMVDVARVGLEQLFKIAPSAAEPLIDELLACVQYIPNPDKPEIVRAVIEDDIEEITTRFTLVQEVFKLHINF